jgi:S-adenosylmethionine synthetase
MGSVLLALVFCLQPVYGEDSYLFSSESVTEGHPDKICDQISDAVLDAVIAQDPNAHVACESLATLGMVVVTGEITTSATINVQDIVRGVLRDAGYTHPDYGMSCDSCAVIAAINKQSPDIARGVDETENHEQGAGDQGLMFGYACTETPELMPLPISLAHKLALKLSQVRKDNTLTWLRPDGKTQVTVKYVNGKPTCVTAVVIAAQHDPAISQAVIREEIIKNVIMPVCGKYVTADTKYFVNETGSFAVGGPQGDTGLTGRKIIVDTYGGMGRHGGGCFSGKDPSKVDRSAAYMARHVAKNIVAAGIATQCEVQIAYCIGVAEPVSVYVNTFGTSQLSSETIEKAVRKVFPLKPAGIIKYLNLKRPIYKKTAAYGHFGRDYETDFTWEQTNKVDELKQALGM